MGYGVCIECYNEYKDFEKIKLDDHEFEYCTIDELNKLNWCQVTLIFQSKPNGWIPSNAQDFVVTAILIKSWNVLRTYLAKSLNTIMEPL